MNCTAAKLSTKNEAKTDIKEKDETRASHEDRHKLDIDTGHYFRTGTRQTLTKRERES